MELRKSETLTLGNIHRSICINQISRRTMRLIAGNASMTMCPGSPLLAEILDEKFGYCLAIIGNNAGSNIRTTLIQKLEEMVFQFITTPSGELLQKIGRPVCSIYFIRVIKECMWINHLVLPESPVEFREIPLDRIPVQMIHYIPFSTRCSTFHLLKSLAHIEHDNLPFTFGNLPLQYSIMYVGSQIQTMFLSE